jgi:acylphosphatase
MKRALIIAKGRVKLVGYRVAVQKIANELNLACFVDHINSLDARIVAEGEKDILDEFITRINIQKPPIFVESIDITFEDVTDGDQYFEIHRRDWNLELVEKLDAAASLLSNLLTVNKEVGYEMRKGISTLQQETMKFGDDLGTMRNELVGEIREQISTLRQERLLIFEKQMLSDMHENFERYDSTLQKTLKSFPYEKSVFIMMPFEENDIRLKTITDTIIKTLKEHGLCGWRADDSERRLMEDIWDNIVVNMLSCKYGIAVFVDKKVLDRYNDEEIIVFNANIALEVGFMKSRGLDILLLKDKRLKKLPTDIISKLYEEFNFDNPEGDVEKAVTKWIERLPVK